MEDSSIYSQNSYNVADDRLWQRPNVSAFITFTHDEVIKGNAVGHKFTPAQWVELKVKMNDKFPDKNYDVKQLQGKSDRLKTKWKKYHKLLLFDTGFGWDYVNDMVTASDETWARHLATHKEDKPLRKKGLPHYRELTTIFAPTTATGSMARASTEQRPTPRAMGGVHQYAQNTSNEHDGPLGSVGEDEEASHASGFASPHSRPNTSSSQTSFRRKPPEPAVVSAMHSFAKANEAIAMLVDSSFSEIELCMTQLHEIPDLPNGSFPIACKKLEDPIRRKMFLCMPACHRRDYVLSLLE